MIDLESVISEFRRRPRRKYTVSEAVRAACQRNLARANAVPDAIRFRSTERRRQACYRNLQLALKAKKNDRSLGYATSFRHGWYVADPERALPLLGATPERYYGHLDAWWDEVHPRDAPEEKLAHALGILSWRWTAGVCLEGDLETLRVCRVLETLARERRPAPGQTGPRPVTREQLTELGYQLEHALGAWAGLFTPLNRIRDRMVRLWQELLLERGEALLDLKTLGCGPRRLRVDPQAHSSLALAEPFHSSGRTEKALCPDPAPLPPPESWRTPAAEVPGAPDDPAGGSPEEMDRREAASFLARTSAREAAMLKEARQLGHTLPRDFPGFLGLVRAAVGTEPPVDSASGPRQWARRVLNFARALWRRLGTLRGRAEAMEARLNAHLGDSSSNLQPENPSRAVERMLFPDRSATEIRVEDMAEFYGDQVSGLTDEIGRRWRRCWAALRIMTRRQ